MTCGESKRRDAARFPAPKHGTRGERDKSLRLTTRWVPRRVVILSQLVFISCVLSWLLSGAALAEELPTDSTTEVTVINTTDPVEETVTDPVEETVTDPVEETVTDPVEETVTDPVEETVTEVVTPITEPITEAVTPITEPVEEVVTPITEPVTDTAAAVDGLTSGGVDLTLPNLPQPSAPVPSAATWTNDRIATDVVGTIGMSPEALQGVAAALAACLAAMAALGGVGGSPGTSSPRSSRRSPTRIPSLPRGSGHLATATVGQSPASRLLLLLLALLAPWGSALSRARRTLRLISDLLPRPVFLSLIEQPG